MTIPHTRDVFNYTLKGIGEEPCAKDHIVLECRAREIYTKSIDLYNPSKRQIKYVVVSDIENFRGLP